MLDHCKIINLLKKIDILIIWEYVDIIMEIL